MAQASHKLARLRRASQLSREQLCAMAQDAGHSVSYPALVQYERGERQPKLGLAIWLARHFDMTVEDLFNGRHEDKRKNGSGADRATRP